MVDPTQIEPVRRKRVTNAKTPTEAAARPAFFDFNNHPVLYVSGAVVATAFACLTYFNEFALPLRTARLEDSAFRATEQAEKLKIDLRREQELNKKSQKNINDLQEKQRSLSRLLLEARTADMFLYQSAYPNGFALVKVGMTVADVYSAYPKSAIEPNENGYLSVNLANSPFESAVYYYDENSENNVITHISFWLHDTRGNGTSQDIVKRLSESLGKPIHIPTSHYAWPTLDKANVFVSDSSGYIIMRSGFRPGDWPTAKEEAAMCKAIAKNMCPIPPQK